MRLTPESIGALVDGAGWLLGGVMCTLLGHRVLGKKPGESAALDHIQRRFGPLWKWGGPILMLAGTAKIVGALAPVLVAPAHVWQRCPTSDRMATIEFPASPLVEKTENSGVVLDTLHVHDAGTGLDYRMTYADLQPGAPASNEEQRLDAIRDGIPKLATNSGARYVLVDDKKFTYNGAGFRDVTYRVDDTFAVRIRYFLLGNRYYRATVVTPWSQREDLDARHFIESFRLDR
jgi:hypothetical protein